MGGGIDRQIVLPISKLPEVHEDVAIAPQDGPAVSGTDVCTAGGSDMAMIVLLPDSYDSIRTTDHPFGVPSLDGASATHPADVLVRLDVTDTVLARGIPGLTSPIIADGRPGGTLLTSVLGSDSPDFLDTGDPELCLQVPKLRGCFWIMDFACNIDPGPDLSVREFGRPLGRPWGALLLAARPQVVEAGCSDLLCQGESPRTLMFRDFLQGSTHVSPALLVREDCGYISAGIGSATPLRDRLVTGSHLFVFPVCRVIGLWEPRMLLGLRPWTIVVDLRTFCALWWLCIMLFDTEQAEVDSTAVDPLPGTFRGFDLTLQSDRLYDLDSAIPDVIGLRAIQPNAAVIKVMSIPDNRCIRVVIPDDHVGTDGLHEVLIHDMDEADPPYVALSELGSLRLDWPRAIFSFMGRYQVDLEHLRHECRERFGSVQSGLCTYCGKYIRQDLGRHVACFHLDLAQL